MTYITIRNKINKMNNVSVHPVKNETSAVVLGILEVAQLFASLLQVQLDKKNDKNEIRKKKTKTHHLQTSRVPDTGRRFVRKNNNTRPRPRTISSRR